MSAADHESSLAAPATEQPPALAGATASAASDRSSVPSVPEGATLDEPTDDPASSRRPSERLGRYLVLGTLGRGGMGTVLEAFDRTLDRRVAVKILHRELGQRHTRRLLREAQAMAKLSHPNVVQVYEVGEVDGQRFIAMELVRGETLAEWLARSPRPGWRRCVEVFVQVGAGLAAAHAQGLVHRDFKPGNAIVDPHGRARVLDFGLARQADAARPAELTGEDHSPEPPVDAPPLPEPELDAAGELEQAALEARLTRAGTVLGTPAYMSPEQMKGLELDARSDQFSFCVSLYEALYGERPFEGSSLMTLLVSMTTGHVRPAPPGTDVPPKLRQAVLRGLSLEPEARWPSMDALLGELRRLAAPAARRWLPLVLAAGVVPAGLGLAYWAEVGLRCEGAAAQLEGIWDEPRKQAVEAAILATALPYAPDTWERVEARLDAYGDAWIARHTEVCEATSVRQEQSAEVMDLRMTCLGRRRTELRAAVGVLAGADAARVRKAVDLVEALPALAECDDVEALIAARAELPPPEDPGVAAEVEAARSELAEAAARFEVGEYAASEAQAHAVVERAGALGYEPLHAEALLRRGAARSKLARHAEAEADLEAAHVLALRQEHDRVQLGATTQLVYVVGYQQHRHDEGLRWGAMAEALADRRETADDARARVASSMAAVLLDARQADAAVERFRRALALHESAHGPRHPAVAIAAANLSAALVGQGKLEEATEELRRSVGVAEEVLGPRHPALSNALGNLGVVLAMQGRFSEARPILERHVTLEQELLGPGHLEVATALGNLGLMLLDQGRIERGSVRTDALASSRQRLEEAVAVVEAARGPGHPQVAGALGNLASVLVEQGELGPARASLERAVSILGEAKVPDRRTVALALASLAKAELDRRDVAAAREHAERAVTMLEDDAAAEPAWLARSRFVLARVLWQDPEQRARARALAERARDGLAGADAATRDLAAEVTTWLAEHPVP